MSIDTQQGYNGPSAEEFRAAIDYLAAALPKPPSPPSPPSVAGPLFFFVALPLALLAYAVSPLRNDASFNHAAARCLQMKYPPMRAVPVAQVESIVETVREAETIVAGARLLMGSESEPSSGLLADVEMLQQVGRLGIGRFGASVAVDFGVCSWK